MIQKGEELSFVLSEPVLHLPRQFCLVLASQEAFVESSHLYLVLFEKASFQAKPVDGLYYGLGVALLDSHSLCIRGTSRVRKPLRLFFLPNDFQPAARAGPG